MNIRQRIFIPMITLAIISSTAVFVSSIILYNRNLSNAVYNRINVASATVEHEIDSYKQNTRTVAVLMAENRELRQAIIRKDRHEILQRANELQHIAQMDFCTILDTAGTVLARTHEPDKYGDSLLYQTNVAAALAGEVLSIAEQGTVIKLAVRTGVPVKDDNGQIVGVVSLGYRLDNQRLVNSFKSITNCEISVFLYDERISTTILNSDGTSALGTKLDNNIRQKVFAGETYIGKIKLFDKNIIIKSFPLYSINNKIIGVISVGEYTGNDEEKIKSFILNGFFITLAVLVICIFLGIYITRSVELKLGEALDVMQEALQGKKELSYVLNILNSLDAMIYVTDIKTDEILFINDSMKKHYDIKGDIVGQICYKVLQNGFDKRCDFCPCYKLDNDPLKSVIWEEHSTKTNRIYRNVDRYIPWLNRQTVHIQHSIDMTELIAAKEFAEQSSRYKSAFLANMSHEVRTPMNAILGIAEIQLREENIPSATQEAFAKIHESGNLLLNIINDILDLSKIEAGRMELIPAKYDVPSLINDTVQLNLLRFESKPIVFKLNVDKDTPLTLYGDELRLKQILNNILSNAFKYTDSGEVILSVSAEYPEKEEKTAVLIFTVKDTGQGMTKEQVNKLFDEYTRFNLEANRTTIGTGLGMTITKALLDMMNGKITVQSKLNKGSVFTVYIPQQRVGSSVCGAELADKLNNFSFHSTSIGKKAQVLREYMPYGSVLVVDDVESNIYVAKGMLMVYGLHIETATSGFEVIDKIKNGNVYDVIFMDHMMPKMDGIETVKNIRAMGYKNPIVALTANALVGQAEIFLESGFDGYISKPIDSRELNYVLNDYIRNKQPPEVVRKARFEQAQINSKRINNENEITEEMAKFFILDAEKSINMLQGMFSKEREFNDSEIESYIIIMHGIKSALANVKERHLSDIAAKLEKAGRDRKINQLTDGTPEFINMLKDIIGKYKQTIDVPEDNPDIDKLFLQEKLQVFIEACADFNKKTAKEALAGLKEKKWPQSISSVLDNLSVLLLHSAFEEAADVAEKCSML